MNLFRNRFVNLREVPLWTVRLSNVSGFITVESLATDNSFFWASLHRKPDGPSGELVLTGEVAFSESGKNSLKDIANDKCDMSRKIPANVVWPNGTFNVRVDLNHL